MATETALARLDEFVTAYAGVKAFPVRNAQFQEIRRDLEMSVRRATLNDLLALNPKAALALHVVHGYTEASFTNEQGKLPFDVVFWVCEVAGQLGIDLAEPVK